MVDRAKKISELQALTSPAGEDLLVIVDSPSSNATTKYVTLQNLLANNNANVTVSNSAVLSANTLVIRKKQTPLSSTGELGITEGTFWYDANYLYIATANNTLKRVALSTF
jgi:hypothetical protein